MEYRPLSDLQSRGGPLVRYRAPNALGDSLTRERDLKRKLRHCSSAIRLGISTISIRHPKACPSPWGETLSGARR